MTVYSKNYNIKKLIKLSNNNNDFINKTISKNNDFTASYIINYALNYLQKNIDIKNYL